MTGKCLVFYFVCLRCFVCVCENPSFESSVEVKWKTGSFPSQPISDTTVFSVMGKSKRLRFGFSLVLLGPNRAYIFCCVFFFFGLAFQMDLLLWVLRSIVILFEFFFLIFALCDEFPARVACVDGSVFGF